MKEEQNATELKPQEALCEATCVNYNTSELELESSNKSTVMNEGELSCAIKQIVSDKGLSEDDEFLIRHGLGLEEWSDPMPLIRQTSSLPYPIDALPHDIKLAIQEVGSFVQCPISLVANSAIASLSLAAQGLANVRRAEKLIGPINLYLLSIADSGERKTTCDNYFTQPIRDWENAHVQEMQNELKRYEANQIAYNAKLDGIKSALKKSATNKKPIDSFQSDLEALLGEKPTRPLIPKLFHIDSTPEALAWSLNSGWHSAGMLTSEAGVVFGSHAMSKESSMRNLALLNILWDGGDLHIERRTSESFVVHGARLTIGLAVQLDTLRAFIDASKGLVRGIGFAARFLITWPESTQGDRLFKESPREWTYLKAFNLRVEQLLQIPLNINERGEINPTIIDLSYDAKQVWITFFNDVELELKPGGEMAETRDVASKAADNAARLAALFHIYENGSSGEISADTMRKASQIVAWHLFEAKRFFSEVAVPIRIVNALKLDEWLKRQCEIKKRNFISRREVQHSGPAPLREKESLDCAIRILSDFDRIKLSDKGKKKQIHVNPKLLELKNDIT